MTGGLREKILRPLLRDRVYVMHNGLAKGLKRRGDPGLRALLGIHPPAAPMSKEHTHLEALHLAGRVVYDVGGHEGVLALFFARKVGPGGRVVSFEPNPWNAARIRDHVKLNGFTNVEVVELGLGDAPAEAELVFDSEQGATGSLDPALQKQVGAQPHAHAVRVRIDSLDRVAAERGLPPPDFVKIDVEGLELAVLDGMKETLGRHHPSLHIEIHGADPAQKTANARGVIERLLAAGYAPTHLESGARLEPVDAEVAMRGHILGEGRR